MSRKSRALQPCHHFEMQAGPQQILTSPQLKQEARRPAANSVSFNQVGWDVGARNGTSQVRGPDWAAVSKRSKGSADTSGFINHIGVGCGGQVDQTRQQSSHS